MQNIHVVFALLIFCVLVWWVFGPTTRVVSARDVYVVDGDTIGIRAKVGRDERIRIANIDAPETRGFRSLWQGHKGEAAKSALKELIFFSETVEITTTGKKDRYRRTLARVEAVSPDNRVDVGRYLKKRGLARAWV